MSRIATTAQLNPRGPGRPPLPEGQRKDVQVNLRITTGTAGRLDAVREHDPEGLPARADAARLCLETGLDAIERSAERAG